ncbi:TPA: hypothetical protein DIC40_03585 [Patescibacteria group bacterium]|nr:hypothetical protein P148_SR1C00001G0438 [candidate division SR1 bacterium RAAC1_SR1_1]HCY20923.1 hypothetical protein [Candidatus Gracilibacteria bacterium]
MEDSNTILYRYTLEEIVVLIKKAFSETNFNKSFHNNFFSDCSLSDEKVYLRPKPCLKFDNMLLRKLLKQHFPEGTAIDITCFLIVIKLPPLSEIAKIIEKVFHNTDSDGSYENNFLSAAKMERGKIFIKPTIHLINNSVALEENLLSLFEKEKYKLKVTTTSIAIYKNSTL